MISMEAYILACILEQFRINGECPAQEYCGTVCRLQTHETCMSRLEAYYDQYHKYVIYENGTPVRIKYLQVDYEHLIANTIGDMLIVFAEEYEKYTGMSLEDFKKGKKCDFSEKGVRVIGLIKMKALYISQKEKEGCLLIVQE